MRIDFVEEAYQYTLKAKDKLKGQLKGKEKLDNLAHVKPSAVEDEPKPIEQKKRTDIGDFKGKCYKCGGEEHKSFECPQRDCGRRVVVVNEMENSVSELEQGESLISWRVLFGDRTLEPCQRSNLFRTCCKFGSKVCSVIVDSVRTDNLNIEEMVQKLGLKRVRHPYPYRIGWLQDDLVVKYGSNVLWISKLGLLRIKYCVILWI